MKFKINKFAGFREICDFLSEVGKKSDSKLENSEIFGFFSQKHPLGEAFFFEKKGALILLKLRSDEVQDK